MEMTLSQKRALETVVEAGAQVGYLSYDPTTTIGNPETAATDAGWTQYLKSSTSDLVEVIYTKS